MVVINIAGKNAVEIPSTSWMSQTISGEAYWIVAATGLAVKEMNASVEIYVKDAEGKKVSTTKTTSLREYAESKLQNTENAEFKTVVDMLNYGAAAQNHFKHDTENLANRNLTAEQQNLATQNIALGTVTAEATGVSKTVSFESDIVLKFKPADTTATIAVITYKPHSASENVTKTQRCR